MILERAIGFQIGAHFGIGFAIGIVHRESIPDIDPDSDTDTGRGVFHPMGAKRQNTPDIGPESIARRPCMIYRSLSQTAGLLVSNRMIR